MKIIGLIPVRLSSKRLKHKALLKIKNLPMIVHTYRRAKMSRLLDDVIVCIESKKIGEIEKGAVVFISKCKVDKCKIIDNDYSGWIKKKYIWGIEQDEKFNINLLQTLEDHFNKSITFIENIFFK